MPSLTWLGLPGSRDAWAALAFDLDGGLRIGGVAIGIDAEPAWGWDEIDGDASTLGVPTSQRDPVVGPPPVHPNGVDGIDHVVYAVPDLDAAIVSMESILGLRLKRRAHPRGPDGPEMAFFRCGDGFIEVVAGPPKPALFGLALKCPDLDVTVNAIREAGGPIGDPKPAVQGGRIASVWKNHVGYPIAIMEPPARG